MPAFSPIRAAFMLMLVAAGLVGMSGRVAYLQTVGRERNLAAAERQQFQEEALPARRGTIFDRNCIVFAATVQKQRLYVDSKFLTDMFASGTRHPMDKAEALDRLAAILGREAAEIKTIIDDAVVGKDNGWAALLEGPTTQPRPKHDRYLILADDLDEMAVDEIKKLNVPGLGFEPTSRRLYPTGSLASHLIGTVKTDGRGQRGLEGLELQFNELLTGVDGHKRSEKTASRKSIAVAEEDYQQPKHGKHLVLTIDANIQMIAEQELSACCQKFRAVRGEVIVMDPHTGEVLAMANYPTFNPSNVGDLSDDDDAELKKKYMDLHRNRCITDPFEAGSVIKPFIAGPAIMWHVTKPDSMWEIPGITYVTPYGRHITDVHGYGPLSTWDVLVKSSNIGMSLMGEKMGNGQLYKALTSFGFGQTTGIELGGENRGRINPLKQWTHFSTESVAQGYEMMVTPLQLARGFCAYANGGRLPPVRLIRGTLESDGGIAEQKPAPSMAQMPQVIDPASAAQMRRILCDVVVRGTATKARSSYWNIFGKTGTAHISQGKAGYSANRYNSSFICGAPYEDPRLVVTMLIHEPQTEAHYGGAVAAPAAQRVMDRALSYMQVPQSPELLPPPAEIAEKLFSFDAKAYKRLPVHQATAAARE